MVGCPAFVPTRRRSPTAKACVTSEPTAALHSGLHPQAKRLDLANAAPRTRCRRSQPTHHEPHHEGHTAMPASRVVRSRRHLLPTGRLTHARPVRGSARIPGCGGDRPYLAVEIMRAATVAIAPRSPTSPDVSPQAVSARPSASQPWCPNSAAWRGTHPPGTPRRSGEAPVPSHARTGERSPTPKSSSISPARRGRCPSARHMCSRSR